MPEPPDPQSASVVMLAPSVWVDRGDLDFSFVRASGPGGQSVNKVSTAAQLQVAVTTIRGLDDAAAERLRRLAGHRLTRHDRLVFQSQTHRSQVDNRRACVDRLRALVEQARRRPVPRKKTKPGRAAVERRLDAKRQVSDKKRRRARPRPDDE
jgi:ribosome-associated protein